MLYNITGGFEIYIIEDIENEIGVFERMRSLDVAEPLFIYSDDSNSSLEVTLGKLRNECYVEPEKWEVKLVTTSFTVGNRRVVEITAHDFFDSEGYTLGYIPNELEYERYLDGEYFTEQHYKAYLFRSGWDDATEDDLEQVKRLIAGYAIEDVEDIDECFEDYEEDEE